MANASNSQKAIHVRTFGAFSLGAQDDAINISGRARRVWSLIAYLIVHRDREVPALELIDVLWTSDQVRSNPVKTLQHNVSRARDMLADLGLPDARQLIVSQQGSYRWNPVRETVVDLEVFQRLLARAAAEPSAKTKASLYEKALSTYRGSFLPGLDQEAWVAPIDVYAHTRFIDGCMSAIQLMNSQNEYSSVIELCENALKFAPESDLINAYYMRALTALGLGEKAVRVYENLMALMADRIGVEPSGDVVAAYEEARQSVMEDVLPIADLKSLVNEQVLQAGGMRCDWKSFQLLVQREVRNAPRAYKSSMILSLSVEGASQLTAVAKRVEETLEKCLRGSDVFAQVSSKQYLVLLAEAGEENAALIASRICERFAAQHPRSKVRLSCEWHSVDGLSL